MTIGITQNYWRFVQPEAPNLKYGCKPDGKVYISLRQELTHGVRPFDEIVTASDSRQMGYFCNYVIDVPPNEGSVYQDADGRGFWYVPAKGYIGEDVISYRIVNIMNQTSEPGCITIIVDFNMVPERIEVTPELIKTTILQNADADYWVEDNELRKREIEREVYAYNTIPDENYALIVTGTWRAYYDIWYSRSTGTSSSIRWKETYVYSGALKPTVFDIYRAVDFADYDVFKFKAKIDDESIGMPANWPDMTADGRHTLYGITFDVGLKLVPIGDIRRLAESSNLLKFINEDQETYPREISDKVRTRLGDKNTYWAKLDAEIKKPTIWVNGREVVALNRAQKAGYLVDISGKTFDPDATSIIPVSVNNLSYFSPVYNDATIEINTCFSKNFIGQDEQEHTAKIVQLTFSLADVPAGEGGDFALVLDMPDLTAGISVPDFDLKFLDRNVDNEYIVGSEYKGLLVAETFTTPTITAPLLATTHFNITLKFTANVDFLMSLESCKDEDGNLEYVPVDLSKVRGFIFVPIIDGSKSGKANPIMLSTLYTPITSSVTNSYKKLSDTNAQQAFYGSEKDGIKPAINYPQALLKWDLYPKFTPDAVFYITRDASPDVDMRIRFVPLPDTALTHEEISVLCEDHRKLNQSKWWRERVEVYGSDLLAYDNWVVESDRFADVHRSAYPEIASITRCNQKDLVGTGGYAEQKYAVVIDLIRLNFSADSDSYTEYTMELNVYDCIKGTTLNSSRVLFDSPVEKIGLLYGIAQIRDKTYFTELQKTIEFTTTPPSTDAGA